MKVQEPHERLKQAREAVYDTAVEAAVALGMKPGTYTHHENGTRVFGREDAIKYARRFRVKPGWIMFGGDDDAPPSSRIREADMRAGAGAGGVQEAVVNTMSNGVTISADAVAAYWDMPESFLRGELRVSPANAWVVAVFGDSGYDPSVPGAPGSLFPGDRVIIDTSDRRPSPPGPFVVWDGSSLVVKLVEPVPGSDPASIRLSSRNPIYRPYEATMEEAVIIGRVRGRISAM